MGTKIRNRWKLLSYSGEIHFGSAVYSLWFCWPAIQRPLSVGTPFRGTAQSLRRWIRTRVKLIFQAHECAKVKEGSVRWSMISYCRSVAVENDPELKNMWLPGNLSISATTPLTFPCKYMRMFDRAVLWKKSCTQRTQTLVVFSNLYDHLKLCPWSFWFAFGTIGHLQAEISRSNLYMSPLRKQPRKTRIGPTSWPRSFLEGLVKTESWVDALAFSRV